ncbi:rRNA adenine N-6-methyltransferase family protein [Candidatus Phytoplasma solani]|uniref:Dimethyladenosine transferase n=2 Tax=16SrXII (Stolbur group) TaxID=85632 RepID=A0A421NUZ0_9MOLU|nr:rRNA adenine N-6-methyltransferase family protein [Candidatus Phytoplasma solani]RMI87823.1 dimethyladenosine transferase [Candidatus Phytoplasma solani]
MKKLKLSKSAKTHFQKVSFAKQNALSIALVIISLITFIWGIVHSCLQTHLSGFSYFQNIFNFTRQSVFLILIVALLAFTKYKTNKFYSLLSFIALINILIVGLVFKDFISDSNQAFISNNPIIAIMATYLQYILLPLFYGFYFWKKALLLLTWKKAWLVLIHPSLYFLTFLNQKQQPFIIPNYQSYPSLPYFKIFLAFVFLTLALIGIKKIKIKFIYKMLMLFLVLFVASVIPRETSDWSHGRESILHPQQMGASFFPEPQETAQQMANLVFEKDQKLNDGEKILELGAGSGNVTKYLIHKFGVKNVIALEYDNHLCQVLRDKYEGLQVIEGDACNFIKLLKDKKVGIDKIKGIVSTLPLSVFTPEKLKELNDNLSKTIVDNEIKFLEYRLLPFLREKHIIEGVKEFKDSLKNQFSIYNFVIPLKIFVFEKKN